MSRQARAEYFFTNYPPGTTFETKEILDLEVEHFTKYTVYPFLDEYRGLGHIELIKKASKKNMGERNVFIVVSVPSAVSERRESILPEREKAKAQGKALLTRAWV